MALPTDMRKALKEIAKPFDIYAVFTWFDANESHKGFYTITVDKRKSRGEDSLSMQQKLAGNQYLFRLKEVAETFDVPARVVGYDGVQG